MSVIYNPLKKNLFFYKTSGIFSCFVGAFIENVTGNWFDQVLNEFQRMQSNNIIGQNYRTWSEE